MLDRKFLLGTTLIAGLSAAALVAPTVAMAQPAAAPAAAPAADDEDEEEADVSALVITGSRIKRSEFNSSAPIQVITSEQSSLEGLVDTAEILQQSSVAAGSFQVNNQLTGFVTDGGPGANTISLRGLGATRTLVLLNGKRVGPAGTRGTVGPVDLNVIPNSIVERFEILKDGASSIYGSDAVAGVINIITKSNLDGLELNVYGNVPFEEGGEQYRGSIAWGKTWDRGYLNASLNYQESKILRRSQRDDTACAADYLRIGGRGGPRADYANTDPSQEAPDAIKCYGLFSRVLRTTNAFGDLIYKDPGVVYPAFNAAGNNAPAAITFGGVTYDLARQGRANRPETFPYGHYDDDLYGRQSILSPVKNTSFYASGGFDILPSLELYGEFLFNKRESAQFGARQFFPSVNPRNPAIPDIFKTVAQGGVAAQTGYFNPAGSNLLPLIPFRSDRSQEVNYWRTVVGIRGDIGRFSWDVFYQHSDSDAEYHNYSIYNDRTVALTGAVRCNQAAITISGGNCADLPNGIDWTSQRILEGNFTQAELDFLTFDAVGNTTYKQDLVEASFSGDLFNLPAGPVGAAFGITARKDEIDDTPDDNEQAGNFWGSSAAGHTFGDDTVTEVFAEFEVPILKGLPGIESLDLQLSGRYTEYDSYGNGDTYKVGLNWQITPAWRIRATKGTSFRAPALYELYLANQTSFTNQGAIDPCITYETDPNPNIQANCAAAGVPVGYTAAGSSSALVITGGGAGILDAETSEAYTVGVIWTPSFIDLSVAVEYFDFLVSDEVRQFGSANILNQCYSESTTGGTLTSPFCSLFTRNGPGAALRPNEVISVNNSYVNIAEQVNRGIDLTIRYTHEFDFGRLTFDSQFTWQTKDTTSLLGGVTEDYNGTTTEPDFTGNMSLRFDRGDWTVFWNTDMIGKQSDTDQFGSDVFSSTRYGTTVYYKQYNEFTAYHSLSVRKKMDDWTFASGIQNVFDERPPAQSAGQFRAGTAALNLYDMRGRRVFFSVTKRF
ncbi:TonB-dependent receptor [Caulobacter sp. NIBR1757]|uniref:TonB-dependent receptor plug domain-containing protein n=1 Tax=Caulobacter sp. NIBR1757 TaxID=3016000 RepID=UPI0022EFE431|nr:TonB-dependent receptor [Caulobacter sp. NIBR1757]WGM40251.1 Vitamin B12 transporter BtuB [Caulobacter sp. NIBR1757]